MADRPTLLVCDDADTVAAVAGPGVEGIRVPSASLPDAAEGLWRLLG